MEWIFNVGGFLRCRNQKKLTFVSFCKLENKDLTDYIPNIYGRLKSPVTKTCCEYNLCGVGKTLKSTFLSDPSSI